MVREVAPVLQTLVELCDNFEKTLWQSGIPYLDNPDWLNSDILPMSRTRSRMNVG